MKWDNRIVVVVAIICTFFWRSASATDVNTLINQKFAGWKIYQQEEGDLNGDGKLDIAAILYKPAAGADKVDQALLVIYLNDGKGSYQLNMQAPNAICVGCGGPKASMGQPFGDLSIQKGQLHVVYQGGSREEFKDELKWRFDKTQKKFFLIGETYNVQDTSPSNSLAVEVGGDDGPEVPDGANDDNAALPEDTIDINYLTMKAEKTTIRNSLTQKGGKNFIIPNQKKYTCVVPSEFKSRTLADFDYENKHSEDIQKILDSCNESIS